MDKTFYKKTDYYLKGRVNAVNAVADRLNDLAPLIIARLQKGFRITNDGYLFKKDQTDINNIINNDDYSPQPQRMKNHKPWVRFEKSYNGFIITAEKSFSISDDPKKYGCVNVEDWLTVHSNDSDDNKISKSIEKVTFKQLQNAQIKGLAHQDREQEHRDKKRSNLRLLGF